ncbi:MAG: NAD(P)-dependent oxidoreductase [Treponema sp.]|uniref:NAD-dependent epimerase/dehydratase family protein n=1 Tax=Treponema sp. TaxID=166 RepID=UPI00298E6A1D|nr:NAD(P)-dependent oxidoreductase [Treponema sp.]MCQ2600276.1 NAD(P)-dependent oxidoreductase [Treponema sp.]
MTIAITGATSMLGVATIKQCIYQNIFVLAFCRPNSKNIERIPDSKLVKIVECDLDSMNGFSDEQIKADVFIHFGWTFTDKEGRNDPIKQMKNVQYTLDAVYLAKRLGCNKFVGAGSQAEYGTPNTILNEDTPVNPVVPYGVAKFAAGKFSKIECEKIGLEYNWVRILSVYGTNDLPGTLISQLIYNAKNNVPMGLSGCEQTWDYLFEDDAGRAFVAISKNGVKGRVYNLGSGQCRKLKDFVQEIIDIVNPEYKPNFGIKPYNKTQPFFLCCTISDLINDVGWKSKVSFREGIFKIVKKDL